MNLPLRVGVIGVGVMGNHHARVLSDLPETDLVGVFDPDRDRAELVADRHGSRSMSLEELLDAVDAVTIASPTTTHAAVALRSLEHGLHILAEKPLAATLDEADAMMKAARRYRKQTFMVGHIERFNPTILAMQSLIEGRTIQELKFTRTKPFDHVSRSEDIVYDLMIHDIDLALELLGDEIESIDATGESLVTDQLDHAEARLRMSGELSVEFVASRVANSEVRSIEVRTESETITADLIRRSITIRPDATGMPVSDSSPISCDEPLRLELQHFAGCVIAGVPPIVGIDAGYRSMVMATTISSLIQRTIAARADRRLVSAAD